MKEIVNREEFEKYIGHYKYDKQGFLYKRLVEAWLAAEQAMIKSFKEELQEKQKEIRCVNCKFYNHISHDSVGQCNMYAMPEKLITFGVEKDFCCGNFKSKEQISET